jgi:DNA modification methylase
MAKRKWVLRSAIIWHRPRTLPEPVKDRPGRSYEYVFMFVKSRRYYFNKPAVREMELEEDVWTIPARPRVTNGIDTAPFPDELVRRCLLLGCRPKGRVLDPYAGSGTTLRVALNSGHGAVGIDLSPRFCEYMAKSLEGMI